MHFVEVSSLLHWSHRGKSTWELVAVRINVYYMQRKKLEDNVLQNFLRLTDDPKIP